MPGAAPLPGLRLAIVAEHAPAAPGTASVLDEHYPNARPDRPGRAPRARTRDRNQVPGTGRGAEAFLTGAAAAGGTKLGDEIERINTLVAAQGEHAVTDALRRAGRVPPLASRRCGLDPGRRQRGTVPTSC